MCTVPLCVRIGHQNEYDDEYTLSMALLFQELETWAQQKHCIHLFPHLKKEIAPERQLSTTEYLEGHLDFFNNKNIVIKINKMLKFTI